MGQTSERDAAEGYLDHSRPQIDPLAPMPDSNEMPFVLFNGLVPMRFRVTPDRETGILGLPLHVHWSILNESESTEVFFSEGGDYRNPAGRPLSYKLRVYRWIPDDRPPKGTDRGNEELWELMPDRYEDLQRRNMGGIVHGARIQPGDGGEYLKKLLLSKWVIIDQPGTYAIRCQRQTLFSTSNQVYSTARLEADAEAHTESVLLDALLLVTVEEVSDEEVEAAVRGVMETSMENTDEAEVALRLLREVRHPIMLSFWGEILKRRDLRRFWEAMQALEGFAERPETIEYIAEGFNVCFEDVRPTCTTDELARDSIGRYHHMASCALSRCAAAGNEEALDRMDALSFGCEYESVRLTFLHAMAAAVRRGERVERAREVMEAYLQDESETIRQEARRYLDQN